jgi:stearoyl-CoA desaturase (delta-9 desaturase)
MSQILLERPPEPREPKRIEGVIPVSGAQFRWQRRITVLMTAGPLLGVAWAFWLSWGRWMGGAQLGIAAFMYTFTGLGISVGFHRYFTHKAFTASRPARILLAVAGSMAVEGSLIAWCATHRRHHAYSDQPGDPHSPNVDEWSLRGLWHAHTGWLFDAEKTDQERWAPDLLKDPMLRAVDRHFGTFTIASFALPLILGFAFTGTWHGAWTSFVWGSLARVFLLHHITWSINSICHFFGTKPYKAKDESTNNKYLGWISFGEAWHNNHHAFPSSAYLGLRWYQPDLGKYLIVAFRWIGWVRDVKIPTLEQRVAKLRT